MPKSLYPVIVTSTSLNPVTRPKKGLFACFSCSDHAVHEPEAMFPVHELIRITSLGTGSFGRVHLVKHPKNREVYALKSMPKAMICESDATVSRVIEEKRTLALCNSPFVCKLVAVAHDPQGIHMVLEAVLCGELYDVLERQGYLDQDDVRFYAAGVACALEHLHGLRIVYRDLKPSNIMLEANGYPKLIDLGFAKQLTDREQKTYTLCGTPEYASPELIANTGHGLQTDWWSVGVLIFELLVGSLPFAEAAGESLSAAILRGLAACPPELSAEAKDVIKRLLTVSSNARLGSSPRGFDEVMDHAFFEGFDRSALMARRYEAPFLPTPLDPEQCKCRPLANEGVLQDEGRLSGSASPLSREKLDAAFASM